MNIEIFQELDVDRIIVENVVEHAFANEEFSDKQEHFLVNRLRGSDSFVDELSLVAKINDKIVGYLLLTKAQIIKDEVSVPILTLAPLAVLPNLQRNGIGHKLIEAGFAKSLELGFESVVVLGHPDYYKKFGFIEASKFNIQAPFEIESKYFMIKELKCGVLGEVCGMVQYAKEFGI